MRVLVVNAGSQSVKLRVVDGSDQMVVAADLGPPDDGLASHLDEFVGQLRDPVDVVGHRVVHGGRYFTDATVIDAEVRSRLEGLNHLAPLHNPHALAGIDAARARLPGTPSVACFDTAFHSSLGPDAYNYAVPADWVTRFGMRRYGFHGLNCAWVARRAPQLLGQPYGTSRLVVCHLGAGASVTAIAGGLSVDTTMGFTPLEGLVMATRSGDVDPGALLFLLQQGLPLADVSDALEYRSGLLGLSGGRSNDMRQLLAARDNHDPGADLAVRVYLHRLVAKIAAMMAAIGGTDAVVFTGGVGENSAPIRSETAARLAWTGLSIDEAANEAVAGLDAEISEPAATIRTLVIHAREELEIAAESRRLLSSR
jgi:acetate kinase